MLVALSPPGMFTHNTHFYYYFDYFLRVSVRGCLLKPNMFNGF